MGFVQSEDNMEFDENLDLLNSFIERERRGEEIPADEVKEMAEGLVETGIYGMALKYFHKIHKDMPPGAPADEIAKIIRKKKDEKEAVLNANLYKNLAALHQAFPTLFPAERERPPSDVLIAGDAASGYRFLKDTGCKFEDITPIEEEFEEAEEKIDSKMKDIQGIDQILLNNFLYCDLFMRLAEKTKRTRVKNELVLYIVEPDAGIFEAIIQTHDLSGLILEKRLIPFVGNDFEGLFLNWFRENAFAIIPKFCGLAGIHAKNTAACADKVFRERVVEMLSLNKTIRDYYHAISDSEWKAKFTTGKLKILLPTDKHSTFVRYCSRDLARAFEKLGHTAQVHISPDNDYSHESNFTLMKHVNEFRPDLIFEIDFSRRVHDTRIDLGRGRIESATPYPAPLPFVWWEQDAEGGKPDNLKNDSSARDYFFAVFRDDFIKTGYSPDDVHRLPIGASDETFHPVELTDEDVKQFGCDVAFAGHAPSWKNLLGNNDEPFNGKLYSALRSRMEEDLNSVVSQREYEELVEEVARTSGLKPRSKSLSEFAREVRIREVGRLLIRSLPVEWIAEAGFNLHLYGSRWEEIPALKPFARGPIENGPPLCKAYRAAKINIANTTAITFHQRVAECMLAGGFVLVKHMPREKDKLSVHDFFEAGVEFDVFRDKNDLIEKIKFYLANEDRRREIAERGRLKALEKVSYTKLMEHALGVVKGKLLAQLEGG